MAGISLEEVQKLNGELLSLKQQLYERKEREDKSLAREKKLVSDLQLATQAIQTLRKDGGGITGALAMFKDKGGGKNSEKVKELENEITKLKRQIAQIMEENEMRSEVFKNNNKHLHGENVRLKELLEKKEGTTDSSSSSSLSSIPPPSTSAEGASTTGETSNKRVIELEEELERIKKKNQQDMDRMVNVLGEKEKSLLKLRDEVTNGEREIQSLRNQLKTATTPKPASKLNVSRVPTGVSLATLDFQTMEVPDSETSSGSSSSSTSNSSSSSGSTVSESTRTDGDTASFVKEIEDLKNINSKLLESVALKDRKIQSSKEDIERILNKLTEKEQEIMKLRDSVSHVPALEKKN